VCHDGDRRQELEALLQEATARTHTNTADSDAAAPSVESNDASSAAATTKATDDAAEHGKHQDAETDGELDLQQLVNKALNRGLVHTKIRGLLWKVLYHKQLRNAALATEERMTEPLFGSFCYIDLFGHSGQQTR